MCDLKTFIGRNEFNYTQLSLSGIRVRVIYDIQYIDGQDIEVQL